MLGIIYITLDNIVNALKCKELNLKYAIGSKTSNEKVMHVRGSPQKKNHPISMILVITWKMLTKKRDLNLDLITQKGVITVVRQTIMLNSVRIPRRVILMSMPMLMLLLKIIWEMFLWFTSLLNYLLMLLMELCVNRMACWLWMYLSYVSFLEPIFKVLQMLVLSWNLILILFMFWNLLDMFQI